jgi:hypothetical protein
MLVDEGWRFEGLEGWRVSPWPEYFKELDEIPSFTLIKQLIAIKLAVDQNNTVCNRSGL